MMDQTADAPTSLTAQRWTDPETDSEPETGSESATPLGHSDTSHVSPHHRMAPVKTVAITLIIVGALYPFWEWLWSQISDWVVSFVVSHLCNLETVLRHVSGYPSGYPT